MATAVIDGTTTRYEVMGSGPPLLMYAPGGFDATVDTHGKVWSREELDPTYALRPRALSRNSPRSARHRVGISDQPLIWRPARTSPISAVKASRLILATLAYVSVLDSSHFSP